MPDSEITLDPALNNQTGVANTSFGSGGWTVTTPSKFSGNVFISGLGWQAVNGLAGGSVQNITWSGDFTTNTPGINVHWQWGAAVYTQFTTNMSGVQLKTVDDNHEDVYQNSDHAGTPENFKSFVIGGARGGGGSNWTGSYSATASIQPEVQTTPPTGTATISGNAEYYNPGLEIPLTPAEGDTITLSNSQGVVIATTTTDVNGDFSFGNLAAGTYTVTDLSVDLSVNVTVSSTGSASVSLQYIA